MSKDNQSDKMLSVGLANENNLAADCKALELDKEGSDRHEAKLSSPTTPALTSLEIETKRKDLKRAEDLFAKFGKKMSDKGQKFLNQIDTLKSEIEEAEKKLCHLNPDKNEKLANLALHIKKRTPSGEHFQGKMQLLEAKQLTGKQMMDVQHHPNTDTKNQIYLSKDAVKPKSEGIISQAIERISVALASRPNVSEQECTPISINVPLLMHQQYALKWLLWRETQVPAGGILADDMGLGKTLTMISLITRQKEINASTGCTLIVCPASIVGQWEKEIQRRCKRGALTVCIYHDSDRSNLKSKLHEFDVVITSYAIVAIEFAYEKAEKKKSDRQDTKSSDNKSILHDVDFDRIILDEAHTIRNPKTIASEAVCLIRANRRWAVTGTPVHNKESDLYSLFRFLHVKPFDDLALWNEYLNSSKTRDELKRKELLRILMRCFVLRRTKDEKVQGSETPLVNLPSREVHTHLVHLSPQEMDVYQRIVVNSQKFLEICIGGEGDKVAAKRTILVLLLRLRQVCCHPALIRSVLRADDTKDIECTGNDNPNVDTISEVLEDIFSLTNPIFDRENSVSSKITIIINELKKVVVKGEKAIVVSQWVDMLEIISLHLAKHNISYCVINGAIAFKYRTEIVEDFNENPISPQVMLLSLCAGGVGLNLVGANHIFLADIHWNPQLESQASDRIYRVGQTKSVQVHKMVCVNTIEEIILFLQNQKSDLADDMLIGTANISPNVLSLNDLKEIFNPDSALKSEVSPNA